MINFYQDVDDKKESEIKNKNTLYTKVFLFDLLYNAIKTPLYNSIQYVKEICETINKTYNSIKIIESNTRNTSQSSNEIYNNTEIIKESS